MQQDGKKTDAANDNAAMLSTQDILTHIIEPYITKNHPDADMVLLTGSHAGAMMAGDVTPLSTSDIDIVIFYEDLQKAPVNASTRIYEYIDNVPGVTGRLPMIDTNVVDYESYDVLKDHFRKDWPCPFLYRMVAASCPIIDRSGRLPQLKADAAAFVAAGPERLSAGEMGAVVQDVQELAEAVRNAPDAEHAKAYGLILFGAAMNLDNALHNKWLNPAKAFRYFKQDDPQRAGDYSNDMALLFRQGVKEPALQQAECMIADGLAAFVPRAVSPAPPPSVFLSYVTEDEQRAISHDLFKFLMFHTLESAETAKARGEGEYYDNLASILDFTARTCNVRDGYTPKSTVDGLDRFIKKHPEALAIFAGAMQGRIGQDMTDLCLDVAGSADARGFKKLRIDYPEDIGYRRHAGKIPPAAAGRTANVKQPPQQAKKNR